MSFHSWLQNLRSALALRRGQHYRGRRGALRAATHRPNLEVLEDRLTPSLVWGGDYLSSEYPYSFPGGLPYDLKADGLSDRVRLDLSAATVSVQLGNADGTFTDPRTVETGLLASSVVAGDFTSDGVPDLAVGGSVGFSSSALEVVPGNGDGTFAEPIHRFFHTGRAKGVADFDGDGRFDLFTMDWTGDFGPVGDVLLGRGDGTFAVQHEGLGLGEVFLWASVGDVNNDGRPDVVAGRHDVYLSDYYVTVYLNDGHWRPYLSVGDATVTEGNAGTASATFTVTLSAPSSQPVTVAYGTGNGTATAGSDYQAANGTVTFAPGETSKTITVLVNGDRLAEPNETFFVNLSNPTDAVIADGRRVREYIGGGQAGVLAAAEDAHRRAERRAGVAARRQEQARFRAVDGLVLQLFELAGLIADASLVTRGYFKHGGEWRCRGWQA
jgi:hypothetical protein